MICKLCNKDMKMRLAKQGKNKGNHFWGCSAYPACKGVQDATEEDVRIYNQAEAPVTDHVKTTTIAPTSNIARVFNESQSSYEFGPAKNRHKVYYNSVEELVDKIEFLKVAGLVDSDLEIEPKDFAKENE